MASAGAHLPVPPWDRGNVQEQKCLEHSQYKEVLNKSRVTLRDNLRLNDVWPHLHEMGVITQNNEDQMRLNATNCDSVDRLINFIFTCQTWCYHALLRAMALSQHGHLIPQGSLAPEVYLQGVQAAASTDEASGHDTQSSTVSGGSKVRQNLKSGCKRRQRDKEGGRHGRPNKHTEKKKRKKHLPSTSSSECSPPPSPPQPPPKQHFYKKADSDVNLPISADLLPALLRHCEVSEQYLMKAPLFGFQDDIVIDITKFHIRTDVQCTDNRESKTIGWRELFCKLFQRHDPNSLLIEGEAGSGKTTFLEDYAYKHCKEFTECEGKGPGSPCVGHSWKLILYIPAGSVSGSQEDAITDNLYCDDKHKDQMMTMIKDDGDGVLVINDGLDELRKDAEKESMRQYTICHQKGGRPKVLNSARHGLCHIEGKFFDRKVTIDGFSIDQGIQYLEKYLEGAPEHLDLLEFIKQQKTGLEWVLTNPLRVHIFSHLTMSGELTQEEIRSLTNAKLLKVLEAFILRRDQKCREADTAVEHSDQFYRLCLELLLKDERTLAEQHIPSLSPYKAFLNMHKKISLYAHDERYFRFGHELFFEYFSIRGLCQYLKSKPSHKKALLLCLCANPTMRNALQVMCGYISAYEPKLHQDLVFIIQACLIVQAMLHTDSGQQQEPCEQNEVIKRLLQLPDLIKKTSAADIISTGLNEQQMMMMTDIAEQIEAAFNENAEHLKAAGWFIQAGYEVELIMKVPTAFLRFITGCIRQCTPSLQREICSQSTHKLLPTALYNVYPDADGIHVFPVSSMRWGVVHKELSATHISVWCPSEVAATLRQLYTQHPPPTGVHSVYIDLNDPADLWGVPPPEVLTCDQWVPALREVLTHSVGGINILTDYVSRTTPLYGLLSALQHIITSTHSHGIDVSCGQVSEEVLVRFCEWAWTVNLDVELYSTTVLLSADRDVDYVTRLHQRVQHVVDSMGPPTYKTPAGQTIDYTVFSSDESGSDY